MSVLRTLQQKHRENKKSIAVLVDPDKAEDPSRLLHLINLASENCVDYFFVGGSLVTSSNLSDVVKKIKENVTIPVVLFPGNAIQVDASADALLFLSLISGRNPATCRSGTHSEKYPARNHSYWLHTHQLREDHFGSVYQQYDAHSG